MKRTKLLLLACVAVLCVLGVGAIMVSATPVPDPELDAAVATAVQAAVQHGEAHPQIVSTVRGDAAALRQTGADVGVTVKGGIVSVTMTGSFDDDHLPPGASPASAKGKYHRMVLFFQNGRVIGGANYVN